MGGVSYLNLSDSQWKERITILYDKLHNCDVCPRNCKVDRFNNGKAICGMDYRLKIASINLHFGEEPPISGTNGSGTVFFSGCSLKCKFCQNYPISHLRNGEYYTEEELAEKLLELQKKGAHNINLVTPTHFIPQIVKTLYIAATKGLSIPIVYNSGGYESVEVLKLLDGIVDIYMPDIKYSDNEKGRKLSAVRDYWDVVRPAVEEMYRQVGDLHFDENGIATKGILIRHLVLPSEMSGTKKILDYIKENFSENTYLSLMSQYFPAYKALDDEKINRPVTVKEYENMLKYLEDNGFENVFIQEPEVIN